MTWQMPRTKDLWQNLGAEHCSSGPEGDLSMFFHVYAMCAVEQGVSI